jgi:hypothetical protein
MDFRYLHDDKDEADRLYGIMAREAEKGSRPSENEEVSQAVAPEPEEGAHDRYGVRIGYFKEDGRALPRLRHHLLWLLHNCVAHPILAVAVTQPTVEFHSLTSEWLNHVRSNYYPRQRYHRREFAYEMPVIEKRLLWVFHNAVAHPLIGLLPFKPVFALHDWSAKIMGVPNWV